MDDEDGFGGCWGLVVVVIGLPIYLIGAIIYAPFWVLFKLLGISEE